MTRCENPLIVSWQVRVYFVMKPCLCSRGGELQARERAVELRAEITKLVGGEVRAK